MPLTLYGIKNCDTVKKARNWLEQNNINYQFHDFRTDGLTSAQVTRWLNDIGLDTLVNKRSTTWKQLDDSTRASFDAQSAPAVIVENPTLIKRPLLMTDDQILVGFSVQDYQKIFA